MTPGTQDSFIQYGALGLLTLVCILAVRVLFLQVQNDKVRETDRADRNEVALRELNKTVQERIIPAALDMVSTTKSLIELMAQQQAERKRRDS